MRFLEPDKIEDALADIAGNVVGFYKRGYLVVRVVLDNCNYFIRINLDKFIPHAVTCGIDRQGLCMRGQFRQGVVVNADAAVAQAGIEFQDDFRRHVEVADRIAARGRKAHAAIGEYRTHFYHGDSGRRDCARAHKVTHLAEVRVDIADAPVIDSLAEARVALVGHAQFHRSRTCKCSIAAVTGRGSRIERYLKRLAGIVQFFGAGGYRERNCLRVACKREARNTKNISILNHCRGIFRGAFFHINPIHKSSQIIFRSISKCFVKNFAPS